MSKRQAAAALTEQDAQEDEQHHVLQHQDGAVHHLRGRGNKQQQTRWGTRQHAQVSMQCHACSSWVPRKIVVLRTLVRPRPPCLVLQPTVGTKSGRNTTAMVAITAGEKRSGSSETRQAGRMGQLGGYPHAGWDG